MCPIDLFADWCVVGLVKVTPIAPKEEKAPNWKLFLLSVYLVVFTRVQRSKPTAGD